jgi:hypothetical protein
MFSNEWFEPGKIVFPTTWRIIVRAIHCNRFIEQAGELYEYMEGAVSGAFHAVLASKHRFIGHVSLVYQRWPSIEGRIPSIQHLQRPE